MDDNAGLSKALLDKMNYQMTELRLSELYSLEAADEVGGIRSQLLDVFNEGGSAAVAASLAESATSRTAHNPNGWQAALYRCLASDGKFCEMEWDV